jgi:hypothetical protein
MGEDMGAVMRNLLLIGLHPRANGEARRAASSAGRQTRQPDHCSNHPEECK